MSAAFRQSRRVLSIPILRLVGRVGLDEDRPAAFRLDLRDDGRALLRAQVGDGDRHARLGERERRCPPDAGSATGHQRDLARERRHERYAVNAASPRRAPLPHDQQPHCGSCG